MNTAIEELIEMAQQHEKGKELVRLAQQQSAEEQECLEMFKKSWKVNELLGEAWEQLAPYRSMSYKNPWVTFEVHAEELELIPFKLMTNGVSCWVGNSQMRDQPIENLDEFAHYLMLFRRQYKEWQAEMGICAPALAPPPQGLSNYEINQLMKMAEKYTLLNEKGCW